MNQSIKQTILEACYTVIGQVNCPQTREIGDIGKNAMANKANLVVGEINGLQVNQSIEQAILRGKNYTYILRDSRRPINYN